MINKEKRLEMLKEFGISSYPKCENCGKDMHFNKESLHICGTRKTFNFHCPTCDIRDRIIVDVENLEIIDKLEKKVLRFADSNRIERKTKRENNRVSNALEEYSKEIIRTLKKVDLSKHVVIHKNKEGGAVGILHLTDLHTNELVSLVHNQYDFNVASRRLYSFVERAIVYFKSFGINNILIASTGDLLNSDRRLDEILSQATNRSNAVILSVHLLKQVILHLNKHFNISYACVSGNESRVKDEIGWSDIAATDNYDFTIFNMLKYLFSGSNVKFILGDPSELIVNVANQNVLLLHGHSRQIKKNIDDSIQKIIGKYALRGIIIRYVLFGHYHGAMVSDNYSRGSSLVGDNDYSDKGLQLSGRASQNIHLFFPSGNIDSIKVDLQVAGENGYEIIKELEAYNAKSADKLRVRKTIFEIKV